MSTIKKVIKEDSKKSAIQILLKRNKENDFCFAIHQSGNPIALDISYNQLCSMRKAIDKAISDHYAEYSSDMTKEKTQAIYLDDPIDW